jgi:hypothetical protein
MFPGDEWLIRFQDDEDEEPHSYNCVCETCIQDHPERDILYGDGSNYDWDWEQEQEPPDDSAAGGE